MPNWPAAGETDWNTKMLAYLAVEHNTDGTHSITGRSIQVVNTQTGAVAQATSIIPSDDTIPQNTEGAEFMTLAITPTNTNNKLKIEVVFMGTSDSTGSISMVVALFQDTTANALAAGWGGLNAPNTLERVVFTHYMTAGTTSVTTFKVRAGTITSGKNLTFNGQLNARKLGGVLASSITITEITV